MGEAEVATAAEGEAVVSAGVASAAAAAVTAEGEVAVTAAGEVAVTAAADTVAEEADSVMEGADSGVGGEVTQPGALQVACTGPPGDMDLPQLEQEPRRSASARVAPLTRGAQSVGSMQSPLARWVSGPTPRTILTIPIILTSLCCSQDARTRSRQPTTRSGTT